MFLHELRMSPSQFSLNSQILDKLKKKSSLTKRYENTTDGSVADVRS